ncbi:preprotein translocase subunit YajC [Holzapfeliella sp. He02]|uniref:Preprotein translocase subunit YajC n=1 Tax=Holzapfeliella saturejae TaxID=3082953 RepID=A0ABU8SFL7_9LACO
MDYSILFLILIAVGFYFFMIRPAQKQQKERQAKMSAMKKGDKIITIGGLHGVIESVNEDGKTVTIDADNLFLTFERNAIRQVTPGDTVEPEDETEETKELESKEETTKKED